MTDSQVLDSAALDRLRQWGGDKLLDQMVKLFLENAGARMDEIRGGLRDRDTGLTEKGSHSLKSSAANVGAESVRQLSAEIENASSGGDLETIESLMSDLEAAFAQACDALETVRGGLKE